MCDEQTHPSQTNIEGGSDLHVAGTEGQFSLRQILFSGSSQDNVHSRVGVDDATHFTDLQSE